MELGDQVCSPFTVSLQCEVIWDASQYPYRLISSVPQQPEVTWELPGPVLVPLWCEVTQELSLHYPEDLDFLQLAKH